MNTLFDILKRTASGHFTGSQQQMTLILPRLAFGNCLRNLQMSSLFVTISSAHFALCRILKTDRKSLLLWACSSVGRAPALQAGDHWFEPGHVHHFLLIRSDSDHALPPRRRHP